MAKIYLRELEHHTCANLPSIGSMLPNLILTNSDLEPVLLHDFAGKSVLFNIYPSIDTEICFNSVKNFYDEVINNYNIELVCISMDSPFALQRTLEKHKFKGVHFLSDMRNRDFGAQLGLTIVSGKLAGFLARAVIIVDENLNIIYHELVNDISKPPAYADTLIALNKLLLLPQ